MERGVCPLCKQPLKSSRSERYGRRLNDTPYTDCITVQTLSPYLYTGENAVVYVCHKCKPRLFKYLGIKPNYDF